MSRMAGVFDWCNNDLAARMKTFVLIPPSSIRIDIIGYAVFRYLHVGCDDLYVEWCAVAKVV